MVKEKEKKQAAFDSSFSMRHGADTEWGFGGKTRLQKSYLGQKDAWIVAKKMPIFFKIYFPCNLLVPFGARYFHLKDDKMKFLPIVVKNRSC